MPSEGIDVTDTFKPGSIVSSSGCEDATVASYGYGAAHPVRINVVSISYIVWRACMPSLSDARWGLRRHANKIYPSE